MPFNNDIIGLIAGGGKFPIMVADSARKQGLKVIAVAHKDETDPLLSEKADKIIWVKMGQLGHIIKALKKGGVNKALMAGTITKTRMFGNLRPDLKGLSLMAKLAIFHDDDILKAVSCELLKAGIEIISPVNFLPELLPPKACLTRRKPSASEKVDINFGWNMAKELGRLDIGQCVVVRAKTVLALEAIEGTNETILRGGKLAREKAVVVKVSKPTQDLRFDMPTVGLETIKIMDQVKASVLAIEAGKTLLFDRSEMVDYANNAGIIIIAQ